MPGLGLPSGSQDFLSVGKIAPAQGGIGCWRCAAPVYNRLPGREVQYVHKLLHVDGAASCERLLMLILGVGVRDTG